jgi:glyoxylase-like metal-dependent hydrolase (beta-lactamase superfamily II)/8-oxo-dGTP pyrophosphatase MutT (NUDIX family)
MPVAPRAAATVVLCRPGPDGLEVLLIRRPLTMAFAAGLHAFPGGAADPGDRDLAATATREVLEEVGVRLRPEELVALGHWVTPPGFARRFDVRFFAAELPAGVTPTFAPGEVADHVWLTPAAALDRLAAGEIAMLPPTATSLAQVAPARSLEDLTAWAPGAAGAPVVERPDPWLVRLELGQAGAIPGRRANAWLVGRQEVVLVDPGDPSAAAREAILGAVESGGGRLAAVALTSGDPDHAAGIEGWAISHGIPILAGPAAGRGLVSDVTVLPDGGRVPVGDVGLVVRSTPGPRPDHAAFEVIRPDRGVDVIVGDLAGPDPGGLRPEPDPVAIRRSLAAIAGLDPVRLLPGHGPVLGREALSGGGRRPASG